jgi:hypothetical protein
MGERGNWADPVEAALVAVESLLLAYMSDHVRPTPCPSWLATQPYVNALLSVTGKHVLAAPDWRVVSNTNHIPPNKLAHVAWHDGHLQVKVTECCVREVRHLGVYTAVLIVAL